MSSALALGILGAALLVETIRSHVRLSGALSTPLPARPPLRTYPSVTVLRPIKGLDAGAAENIAVALHPEYPGKVETFFIFDDENEPALPLVRDAIAKFEAEYGRPPQAEILFCGAPRPDQTGKLNAMLCGFARANHDVIACADSDIRPGPTALKSLVETLYSHPVAGSAFAPVAVTNPPDTMCDAGYALLLNAMFGPHAAATTHRNGGSQPFIMGQYMVFKREAIAAIGGFDCARGQLVDDMFLGERIAAAGFRNMVSHEPISIIQRGLRPRTFWGVFIRWVTFSRTGLPFWKFKAGAWVRASLYYAGLIGAIVAASMQAWPEAVLLAASPIGVSWSNGALHRQIGGEPLRGIYHVVPFLLLLIAPFVLLSIKMNHEVDWRGRKYQLNAASRLRASRS